MARRPSGMAPTMFDGPPTPGLFGPALQAALGNTHPHPSQLARSPPPPRIPGNYANPPFPGPPMPQHHQGHASRPSMAGFVPSSMPPGYPGMMPGSIPQPGLTLPTGGPGLPMKPIPGPPAGAILLGMPGPVYPPPASVSPVHSLGTSSVVSGSGHGRSPSQLHIPHSHHSHHQQASPASLSPGFPALHGHARSPSQAVGGHAGPGQGFEKRSRRQPSIGGPPKAALGGPQARKNLASAVPAAGTGGAVGGTVSGGTALGAGITTTAYEKPKKYIVLLPLEVGLEGIEEEEEGDTKDAEKAKNAENKQTRKRSLWSRQPVLFTGDDISPSADPLLETVSHPEPETDPDLGPPYILLMPVPGAWDRYKQEMVDLKLASLGFGLSSAGVASNTAPAMQMPIPIPALMAPAHAHARSLSMTSTFSPGLLQYKLAKLSPVSPLDGPSAPFPSTTSTTGGSTSFQPSSLADTLLSSQSQTQSALGRRLGHQSSMSLSAAAPEFQPRFFPRPLRMGSLVEEQEPEEEDLRPKKAQQVVQPDKPKTAADFARGFGLDDASEVSDHDEGLLSVPNNTQATLTISGERDEAEGDASGLSVYQDPRDPSVSLEGSTFGTAPEPDLSLQPSRQQSLEPSMLASVQVSEMSFESAREGDLEGEEEDHEREDLSDGASDAEDEGEVELRALEGAEDEGEEEDDGLTLPSHSRRPTATFPAFSGGRLPKADEEDEEGEATANGSREQQTVGKDGLEENEDPAAEWTASEDPRTGEEDLEDVDDDDLSDGMWSNPSDEERHRQERLHKRMLKAQGIMRHASQPLVEHTHVNTQPRPASEPHGLVQEQDYDSPRRLPKFPTPPNQPQNHGRLDAEAGYMPTQRSERSYSHGQDGPHHVAEDNSEVLSNPSEEAGAVENFGGSQAHANVYYSHLQPAPYPIPFAPIPYPAIHHPNSHSPHASITMSTHSRSASNTVFSPEGATGALGGTTLNPHAKPFVFGAAHTRPSSFAGSNSLFPGSPASITSSQQNPYPTPPSLTHHARQASVPRLNAHAPEFRPTFSLPDSMTTQGFDFQPPPQAPSLSFELQAESTRMIDSFDAEDLDGRPLQGREKRRRRTGESDDERSQLSDVDGESDKENVAEESDEDNKRQRFAEFQFPPPLGPPPGAVSQANDFGRRMTLDPIQTEFTFEFPNWSARASAPAVMPMAMSMPVPVATDPEPPARLPQSASMPIEFTHPNTKVPASLFKALNAYGSDSDGRGKRSRLASRDFHSDDELDGSIADTNARLLVSELVDSTVAEASSLQDHSAGQSRTLEIAMQQAERGSFLGGLVAQPHAVHRASSMPHMRTPTPSQDPRPVSTSTPAASTSDLMEEFEARMTNLIQEKMSALGEVLTAALAEHAAIRQQPVEKPAVDLDDLVQRVAEAVEARVQDNLPLALTTRSLPQDANESQIELFKSTVADEYESIRQGLLEGIGEICRRSLSETYQAQPMPNIDALLESSVTQTREAISSAMSGFQELLDNLGHARTDDDRELLLSQLSAMVLPQIASLRVEPLDVDLLTERLSEAVKPHITQLIDLASDKKETAGLIVQRLGPLLSSMMPAPLDVNAISEQMAGYVERLMPPPLNVKTLKQDILEGLADIVKKQLAETLTAPKPEELVSQIKQQLEPILSLKDLVPAAGTFDNLVTKQETLHSRFDSSMEATKELHSRLGALPTDVATAMQALGEVKEQLAKGVSVLAEIQGLQKLASENTDLQRQLAESSKQVLLLEAEKTTLEASITSARSERDIATTELRELRIQLESWKTRASDEKTLRDDVEKQITQKDVEVSAAKSATAQVREKLAQVEADKADVLENNLRLKAQVSKLEREASKATIEVEVLREKVLNLERSRDEALSQQSHWDDIRRTAQQVEVLTKLISSADDEELHELRRQRDRSKVLEGEFAALKKRYDEQESKLANLQRNAIASKNSIAQVQQRSTEWEKKCKTAEAELSQLKSERETGEALRRQLESDMNMMQHRLDEADRREVEYQARQGSLEAEVQQLRQQLEYYTAAEQSRPTQALSSSRQSVQSRSNNSSSTSLSSYGVPSFPLQPSYSSMSMDETADETNFPYADLPEPPESHTPRVASPSGAGLWASMHAPVGAPKQAEPERATTPKPVAPPSYARSFSTGFRAASRAGTRTASPAMSSVSVAPTEGDDGWWS